MRLIDSGRYLPPFMRDFHDQKYVFKSAAMWGRNSESNIGWIEAHCYVIDIFLQFMALHGYTLQKSKTNEKTYKISQTINNTKNKEGEILKSMFEDND